MPDPVNPRLYGAEPMRRCKLEECKAACCLYGAWVDTAEAEKILDEAALFMPLMSEGWDDPGMWFEDEVEPDAHALSGWVRHTRVVEMPEHYGGTACVFLRKDYKCALQAAAEQAGMDSWRYKPFYCILHPLDLDKDGRITLDETEALLEEPGSCLRKDTVSRRLVEVFEPELRHFLGEAGVRRMRRGPLLVTKGFDRFEVGGAVGRIDAEE